MRESVGDGGHEALTGETTGWVLSHEMTFWMPTLFRARKATCEAAIARAVMRSGVVEDPSMPRCFLHGNREISRSTNGDAGGPRREGESRSR